MNSDDGRMVVKTVRDHFVTIPNMRGRTRRHEVNGHYVLVQLITSVDQHFN